MGQLKSSSNSNKVALVTGAGRGMGRAIAHKLSQEGIVVVVNDIDSISANETTEQLLQLYGNGHSEPGDVTDAITVQKMVDHTVDMYGSLDILVNNAGVLRPTNLVNIEEDEWNLVISGNLTTTFLCMKAVIPIMQLKQWGRIVNFSSTAGKNISTVGGPHYTAAKAGILGLTRHVAKEVASFGITVNAVCPGLIDTEMIRNTISDARTKEYAESFPISRLGSPTEVADLVSFLASDKASYITGASLDINGGDLMI